MFEKKTQLECLYKV